MDTQTVFIIAYCIQIPIALYALLGIPMRGELATPYENLRKSGMILFGILPCAFLSVIIQLGSLAVYMAKVKSIEGKARRAQSRLGGRQPDSASGNPFSGERSAESPTSTTADNPFFDSGRQAQAEESDSGPNPLVDHDTDDPTPPKDNPFA